MTESSPGRDGGRCSDVEQTVTGVAERGGDDSTPEVVAGGVGGFVTVTLDGVNTEIDSSCSRSLAVHVSTTELDSNMHLVTSSDFTSGSSTSSSSNRHCFPSSSIC